MCRRNILSLVFCGLVFYGIVNEAGGEPTDELEQAKLNVISLIQQGNYAEAQVQTQRLLVDFSEHEEIAKTVWQIAKTYDSVREYDKAFELNQYNIVHFSNDVNAVLSQVEIVKFHFRKGDNAAVDASVNNFLTAFSGKPSLSKGIYHIARRYDEFKRYDKAIELHQYNVDHFPDDIHAIWSQVEVIYSNLRKGDAAAANAAFDSLLVVFSDKPTLPKEVYNVARKYDELKKYDKAIQLHQYLIERWTASGEIDSRKYVVMSYIAFGDEETAQLQLDKLNSDFNNHPDLLKVLSHDIAEGLYDKAFQLQGQGLAAPAGNYFQKAVDIWEMVTKQSPELTCTADGYSWAGHCYRELGQYEKAIACYNNVADKYPEHGLAWNALYLVGTCYEDMVKSEAVDESEAKSKIRDAYQQLVEKYPDCKAARIAKSWLSENQE